ncbi:MAG: hypothetical protein Q8R14_03165 [Candidatus Omnitrophota bacterium]|nr:hypothetical protein [Candidatus Omnitrophota bacterium]
MLYIIYTLSNTIDFVRKSNMARVPFEVAMIKLTRMGSIVSSADLMERLEKIESGLKSKPNADPGPTRREFTQEPRKETKAAESLRPDKKSRGAGLDEIIGSWNAITDRVQERKISVAMYLKEGYPESVDSGTLSISFPKSSQFHKDTLESPECKNIILKAIKDVTGLDLKLKFTISENGGGKNGPSKGAPDDSDSVIKEMPSKKDGSEPIISDALEIFGGEIEGETGRGKTR